MFTEFSLEEAIVLARDTYQQLGRPSHPVQIDPILRYAERVESASSGSQHEISVMTAEVKKSEYRGIWIRSQSSSTIYISNELNECWQRFVICKEAIQLLVDTDVSRYAKSIRQQTQEAFEMYWPTQARTSLTSEVLAAVVAFEVLYPWEYRKSVKSPPDDMHKEALDFKIPERHLDAYFRCPFGTLSEAINQSLHS